jgi:DNA-directed RNA polymerase subunit RPC12/RpoP
MKFKKSNKIPKGLIANKDDKVVISSEHYTNERPSYLCSFCNQTLIRLTDAGMNNTSYWCRNCSVEFNPEDENLRKESKLIVPDRNIEPAITSVGNIPDVNIRHEPEIKGTFKELQRKGLKITHYEEHNPK